jgi:hypothetical protein
LTGLTYGRERNKISIRKAFSPAFGGNYRIHVMVRLRFSLEL